MTFPKARLVVSACLLLGWLGFLFYLVLESNTVILSKPQFAIAQVFVVAQVRDRDGRPDPRVTVEEVIWPGDPASSALVKTELRLAGLAETVVGYEGPGAYLMPLLKGTGGYRIAPLPAPTAEVRIYPWNAGTQAQVNELVKSQAELRAK